MSETKPSSKRLWLPGWAWPLILGAGALVLYLLSRSASLDDFDSYSFAMALDQFDIALQQPQPPGYIVYMILGRAFRLLWPDALTALTTLSAVSGAVTVGLVCWLGQMIFRRDDAAILAAVLFALIPLQWLTAAKALSDAPGLALSLGAVALVWAGRDDDRLLVAGALLMGLSMGVRPQANIPGVLLLAGLFIGRLRQKRWQPVVIALAGAALVCVAWFVPTVASTGGLAEFRALLNQTSDLVMGTDSLFGAGPVTAITLKARTLEFLDTALRPTLGVNVYAPLSTTGVVILAALVGFLLGGLALADWRKKETWLLLAWLLLTTVPLLLLESLSRERRFIPLLPPLILLVIGGWVCGIDRNGLAVQIARWAVPGAAALGMLVSGWPLARTLADVPAPHTQAAQFVREHYAASETLVAAAGSFRTVQVELPGTQIYYLYQWPEEQVRAASESGQYRYIAVFDRDFFDPAMDALSAGDRYVPIVDQTFTRDSRVHLLANEVRLQVLTPIDALRPEDLALPPDGVIDLGGGNDGRFVGAGWFRMEDIGGVAGRWAGDRETSVLRVTLAADATYTLTFHALAFPQGQDVTVLVNGVEAGSFELAQAWAEYNLTVTPDMLPGEGITTIELQHTEMLSAYDQSGGASPDQRGLTAAYDWVRIVGE